MIGSVIGDLVGSTREFKPIKKTEFQWIPKGSAITDDSILSIATADALLSEISFAESYKNWGRAYPNPKGAYGVRFKEWLHSDSDDAYGSYGNGAPMRVAAIGWLDKDVDYVISKAAESASCTHNHPEGIKGAQCIAEVIWHIRNGMSKNEAILQVAEKYEYDISKTLFEIRPDYRFDETSQGTVPVALRSVFEAENMEQAVRFAISVGGDADTLAAIAGSIAEACFEPDYRIFCEAISYLPSDLSEVVFQALENTQFGYGKHYSASKLKLIHAYKNAIYEIHWNDQVETVLLDSKQRSNKTTIGIISGYNPNGQMISEVENQEFNNVLKHELEAMKCTFFPALGKDTLGIWEPEFGFAVLGLTKDQLISLAKQFNQNAIVYLEDGKPSELVWCA